MGILGIFLPHESEDAPAVTEAYSIYPFRGHDSLGRVFWVYLRNIYAICKIGFLSYELCCPFRVLRFQFEVQFTSEVVCDEIYPIYL